MKKKISCLLLLFLGVLLFSCSYDYIAEEVVVPPDTTVDVLFSTQIAPIFTDKCVSCHKAGSQSPDLAAANAYNSLISKNLVNKTTPASSVIYTELNPANTSVHAWKKYSATEAALVLTWIQQGAKNN